jgi:hypothetical protein
MEFYFTPEYLLRAVTGQRSWTNRSAKLIGVVRARGERLSEMNRADGPRKALAIDFNARVR